MTADPTRPEVLDTVIGPQAVSVTLHVPATLPWFRGHFPGHPILPGVVQLAWAMNYSREHFGFDPAAERVVDLKFMRVIRPAARLTLDLGWSEDQRSLSFRFSEGASLCSSGRFILAQ